MKMKIFTTALFLSSLSGLITACGNIVIKNDCPYNVWVWTAVTHLPPAQSEQFLSAALEPGQRHTESYRWPDGGGPSMKFVRYPTLDMPAPASGVYPHSQFEYTMSTENGKAKIHYDLSNIECGVGRPLGPCPMEQHGFMVESGPCKPFVCHAGEVHCNQAYNKWNDNTNIGCFLDHNHDTVVVLCRTELEPWIGQPAC